MELEKKEQIKRFINQENLMKKGEIPVKKICDFLQDRYQSDNKFQMECLTDMKRLCHDSGIRYNLLLHSFDYDTNNLKLKFYNYKEEMVMSIVKDMDDYFIEDVSDLKLQILSCIGEDVEKFYNYMLDNKKYNYGLVNDTFIKKDDYNIIFNMKNLVLKTKYDFSLKCDFSKNAIYPLVNSLELVKYIKENVKLLSNIYVDVKKLPSCMNDLMVLQNCEDCFLKKNERQIYLDKQKEISLIKKKFE